MDCGFHVLHGRADRLSVAVSMSRFANLDAAVHLISKNNGDTTLDVATERLRVLILDMRHLVIGDKEQDELDVFQIFHPLSRLHQFPPANDLTAKCPNPKAVHRQLPRGKPP